jgi:hypothetical protein
MSDKRTRPDEMRDEYDFRGGIRGKYFERYQEGTNVVVIAPDLVEDFPDSESVNEALRQVKRDRQNKGKPKSLERA